MKPNKKFGAHALLILAITLVSFSPLADNRGNQEPNEKYGAFVFQSRCTLCHGNFGMGEGILPLIIKDYPDTNLLAFDKNADANSLRKSVLHGSASENANEFSPPWSDELSYTAVESVVKFLIVFYADNDKAHELLEMARKEVRVEPKINTGLAIYRSRCMVCHGESGNADGPMAKRLRIPPANLVKSRFKDDYLINIISKGGQAVSRSYQMPPWEGTLTNTEISSVVMYIKTLRE